MARKPHQSLQISSLRASLIFTLLIAVTSPYMLLPLRVAASTRKPARVGKKENLAGALTTIAKPPTGATGSGFFTPAPQAQPSPTPNYGGIIFAHGAHPASAFYKINPDGTNKIALNDLGSIGVRSPSVSRVTGMIAFSNIFTTTFQAEAIFVMNGDGSGIREITFPGDFVRDFNPRISPDGTKIAFISNRFAGTPFHTCNSPGNGSVTEGNEVFVINVDGTGLTQITTPWYYDNMSETCGGSNGCSCFGGDNFQVAWTSDSQHLAILGSRFYQRYSGDTRVGSTITIEAGIPIEPGSPVGGRLTTLYRDDPRNDPANASLPDDDPSKRVLFPISSDVRGGHFDVEPDNRILFPANLGGTGFGEFSTENDYSIGLWTPGTVNVGATPTQTLMGQIGFGGSTDGAPHGGNIDDARFSPDGQHVLIFGNSPRASNNAKALFIDSGNNPVPGLDNFLNINVGIAWAPGDPMPQPAQLVITPNPVLSYDNQRTPVTPTLLDAQGNVIARTAQWTQLDEIPFTGFRCDGAADQIPCAGFAGRDATIDFTGAVIGNGNPGQDNLCEQNAGIRACVPHYNTAGDAFLSVSATTPIANASGAGGPGLFTIRRESNPPTLDPIFVNFSVSGTAVRDLDYAFDFSGNTITLPVGQNSVDIHVRSLRRQALDKTVVLALQPDTGTSYSLYAGATTATVTIKNDNTSPTCVTAPSGMVGWWSGDGNTNDVLGNNNGIPEGNLTFSPGFVNQAFTFDGTTTNVRVPASAGLNVGTGSGMTIDAWIDPSDLGMRPIVEWNTNGNYGPHFWMSVGGYGPVGSLFANLQDTNGNGHVVHTNDPVLIANTYQHVALTYDKTTGNVAIYVNGSPVPISTTNLGVFTPATSLDLNLGTRPGYPDHFSGRMDEVEVFNRALSSLELYTIYSAGTAGKCKPGASPSPTPIPTPAALSISSITPNHGGDQGVVTATIYGQNIEPGATVRLSRSGQADINGESVSVPSSGSFTALFNLIGRAQGAWDVVVTNPDNSSATLPDGFTIQPTVDPRLWVSVLGRDTIRASHTATTYTVAYGNTGNVDAYGVPLFITGIPGNTEVNVVSNLAQVAGMTDPSTSPVVSTDDYGQAIPLLLPVVQAGSTGYFRFTLRASQFGNGSFDLSAVIMTPLVKVVAQNSASPSTDNEAKLFAHANRKSRSTARLVSATPFGFTDFLPSPEGIACLYALAQAGITCGSAILPFLRIFKDALLIEQCIAGIISTMGSAASTLAGHFAGASNPSAASWTQLGAGTLSTITGCGSEAIKFLPLLGNILNGIACLAALKDFNDACFQSHAKETVHTVASADPNEKIGYLGLTTQHYVASSQELPYSVLFENTPEATAPAQTVVVTDQLDATKLDLSTFSLGLIGFGEKVVTPGPGLQMYDTDVDLRPDKNLIVRIHAALNTTTGIVTWQFQSIDPATNLPTTNPNAGFLPPDIDGIIGEGSVLFSVMPKSGLNAGTVISNQAAVTFDLNSPMNTNTFTNTIDDSKPTSSVTSATQATCANDVNVQWSGSDSGSGIGTYTIFVSDNGGPFTEWLTNTTDASATYKGTAGHSYGFYSIARDNAGNAEDAPATADAIITAIANTPPTLGYSNANANLGASLNINPSSGPSDNGSITSIALLNQGTYTGGITVNNSTGVISLTNAGPAGTHSLTVRATDNCGLTTDAMVQLRVVNTAPTIGAVGVMRSAGASTSSVPIANVNDAEQTKNTLVVTINGGSAATANNVTVSSLSISAAGVVTANVATPCNSATANFTLTVTDAGGLTSQSALTVTVIPPPAAPTAISNSPVFVGGTLNLTASSVPGATYAWTGPNGFTSNQQNPSITNVTLAAAGTYYVTVRINGCPSPAGSVNVVVNQSLQTTFVIGDRSAVIGKNVMFWGSDWAKNNSLSGGSAPSSFKGYANSIASNTPNCGGTWKSDPGGSSKPPASVPQYITVLVASSVTKSGSTISGNITEMVVLRIDPGYGPDPSKAGTGTVIAVICPQAVASIDTRQLMASPPLIDWLFSEPRQNATVLMAD